MKDLRQFQYHNYTTRQTETNMDSLDWQILHASQAPIGKAVTLGQLSQKIGLSVAQLQPRLEAMWINNMIDIRHAFGAAIIYPQSVVWNQN